MCFHLGHLVQVSFNSCSIPGMLPARPVPADEMEADRRPTGGLECQVGLGIHGEPGLRVKATSSTTAKDNFSILFTLCTTGC